MKLYEILQNLIKQENLIPTFEEIVNLAQKEYNNDDESNILIALPMRWKAPYLSDEKLLVRDYIKDYILQGLEKGIFTDKYGKQVHHNKQELLRILNHLGREYIEELLNELVHEKKILMNIVNVSLYPTEQKRRELIQKVQNMSEEELDKLI